MKRKPNQRERRKALVAGLVEAAQALALAHHEVGFAEGYRACYEAKVSQDDAEAVRMREKHDAQWKPIERAIALLQIRLSRAVPRRTPV